MSEERFATAGEAMIGRTLRKEERAGVSHFVTGQHQAEIVEDDTHLFAILTFVNVMGHAVLLLCRKSKRWEPWGVFGEAGHSLLKRGQPPEDWEFSDDMLAALRKAECEWEKKFPSGS